MPLRIGHRGASGTHPENTLAAFRRAVELGVQGIEFDVHRTADGELVVMHDPMVDRTTAGTGLIMTMTLAQIKSLEAGAWKGPEFAGEPVPTLREVIRATPADLLLFCELKAGSIHYPGIEQDLLALIEAEGARSRFQISSFDHKALKQIHELSPTMPLGMLYEENLLDPISMARAIGATALHPAWMWVTPELVKEAHAAGLTVNTWVVDLPPFIDMMKGAGVDGIMSNYPDRL
ncbi:MAG TPA: glycerophosphodiester phosphodiesterase [Symbiobacteriaceae bacterium]|jgi:glycerophosphoryl diester phosphodiesterase